MTETPIVKNNPKTIRAWAFFDWANSAYALVITVAIFPPYFYSVANDNVNLWGLHVSDTTLFSWSISLAYLVIAFLSPILSGIADYSGRKMYFMRFFTTMGALACMSMWFFTSMDTLWLGILSFILATIGFAGGIVFNNAYIPEISSKELYDQVSAKGFSYGYVGSVLLLLLNLLVIIKFDWFGFRSEVDATRAAFVMVGIWWLGFSLIPFRRLPRDEKAPYSDLMLSQGYQELGQAWQVLKKDTYVKRFLLCFFLYNGAVQAVLFLASTFATKELNFALDDLIVLILVLQLVAIVGAWIFSRVSTSIGNRASIALMLLLWTVVCFLGYAVKDSFQFYVLAGGVGLVMGGIQSLSRSTYAKYVPEGTQDSASFFSFYDVMDKTSTVFGTFLFGIVEYFTQNMRLSLLALSICFLMSLITIKFVKVRPMQS